MRYWGGTCRQTCPIQEKYMPYICIHSKWHLLPFAHIAPSQLHTDHTDLGHCAKGHDGVYLVFFMLTCTRRTHGQILSTYLYVISLYSSLDLIIFIQHSLGIPSGRWSGVARLGVCPWRRRAKKPRILAGSTDCLGHSWDLRDSDQWPPVPIAIEVKHFESMTRHSKYLKDHETCLKILPFSLRKVDPCRIQNVLRSSWRFGACIAWIYVDSLLFCAGLWINFTLTIDHHIASGFLVSSSMHLEC